MPELDFFPDIETMSTQAARLVARAAWDSMRERGHFTFAISGGSTPRLFFQILAQTDMPWSDTHVFWVDERCVAPRAPESNYRLARELLLDHVAIPAENIQRMPGEARPIEIAAREYEQRMVHIFRNLLDRADEVPRFDVIHLGMGEDGHTASLFPGEAAAYETERLLAAVDSPGQEPRVPRLSMTLPLIAEARRILFLVSGRSKAALARSIAQGESAKLPAAQVQPARLDAEVRWLVSES